MLKASKGGSIGKPFKKYFQTPTEVPKNSITTPITPVNKKNDAGNLEDKLRT